MIARLAAFLALIAAVLLVGGCCSATERATATGCISRTAGSSSRATRCGSRGHRGRHGRLGRPQRRLPGRDQDHGRRAASPGHRAVVRSTSLSGRRKPLRIGHAGPEQTVPSSNDSVMDQRLTRPRPSTSTSSSTRSRPGPAGRSARCSRGRRRSTPAAARRRTRPTAISVPRFRPRPACSPS